MTNHLDPNNRFEGEPLQDNYSCPIFKEEYRKHLEEELKNVPK